MITISFRIEKNMRIVDEIVGFFFKRGCTDVSINLKYVDEDQSLINIEGDVPKLSEEDFEDLNDALNRQREVEIEECYWLLSGDDSFGDELHLIGSMIDDYKCERNDNYFKLTIFRKEHKNK